jgi:hypothetical protein
MGAGIALNMAAPGSGNLFGTGKNLGQNLLGSNTPVTPQAITPKTGPVLAPSSLVVPPNPSSPAGIFDNLKGWWQGNNTLLGKSYPDMSGDPIAQYSQSMQAASNQQTVISGVDAAVKAVGIIGAMSKKRDINSKLRPELLSEKQILAPIESMSALARSDADQTLASALYASREGGNPSTEGIVASALKNDLAINAQRSGLVAELINENNKLNAEIQAKNAATQMGYYEYQDQLKWAERERKDALTGQLISLFGNTAIPILQTRINAATNTLNAQMLTD